MDIENELLERRGEADSDPADPEEGSELERSGEEEGASMENKEKIQRDEEAKPSSQDANDNSR